MIKNHTQLLNWLIERNGLTSYLEIGVQSAKNNFNKINVENKWGVDPDPDDATRDLDRIHLKTSDEYFDAVDEKVCLIFIDGLHHADQVKRDFENSLRCLNDNGFIVIHDTCPDEEKYTTVPRETRKWYGNVWMFAVSLNNYTGIDFVTLDIDCGITIIWKDSSKFKEDKVNVKTWDNYVENKKEMLRIIYNDELNTRLTRNI